MAHRALIGVLLSFSTAGQNVGYKTILILQVSSCLGLHVQPGLEIRRPAHTTDSFLAVHLLQLLWGFADPRLETRPKVYSFAIGAGRFVCFHVSRSP
jgi:hypothetical protein